MRFYRRSASAAGLASDAARGDERAREGKLHSMSRRTSDRIRHFGGRSHRGGSRSHRKGRDTAAAGRVLSSGRRSPGQGSKLQLLQLCALAGFDDDLKALPRTLLPSAPAWLRVRRTLLSFAPCRSLRLLQGCIPSARRSDGSSQEGLFSCWRVRSVLREIGD